MSQTPSPAPSPRRRRHLNNGQEEQPLTDQEQQHGPVLPPSPGPLVGASPDYIQQPGGTPIMRPSHTVGGLVQPVTTVPEGETAEDRERQRAKTRGVEESLLPSLLDNTAWFVSNRVDDRVVIFERDPLHPGGECFIGGSAPCRAYRTENINRLLMNGEIIEVPEPRRTLVVYDPESGGTIEIPHPRRPLDIQMDIGYLRADVPGQTTRLGRMLDSSLWEPEQIQQVARRTPRNSPNARPAGYVAPRTEIDRAV